MQMLEWLQGARLMVTVALTVVLGSHAYWRHRLESRRPLSSQRWVFWIYAAVFLILSVVNFGQAWLVFAFGALASAPSLMAYATLLATLSYVAFVVGTRVSNGKST